MSNNHKIATRIPEKLLFSPFKFISVVDYPPDSGEKTHHKHDFFQIIASLSGEFELWDKHGGGVVVRPGCFLIIPPEWPHAWRIENGCKAFQVSFFPFLAEEHGELFLLFGDIKSEWRMFDLGIDILNDFFKKIESEFDSKKPAGSALIHSYLIELFAFVLRKYCDEEVGINGTRNIDMAALKKTLNYMRDNYRRRITVKELAANSYLGESRFFQIFKKYTGSSPLNYLNKLRMEKAKALVIFSHMSISQIADYLGYESVHYFSRAYKKYYDTPPSEDRVS